jgi:two-component system, NtrC family, response regulator AtoC
MNRVSKLLTASPDRQFSITLAGALSDTYDIDSATTGTAALEKLKSERFDILILDCSLNAMSAVDVMRKISSLKISVCVIAVATHEELDAAGALVKRGAYDYIFKPIDYERLRVIIKNALDKIDLQSEIRALKEEVGEPLKLNSPIMNSSSAMQKIISSIERVMNTESTILISGESGTGKGVLARAIHYGSNRHAYPFRALDCSAMPEDLIASELFGHEKGAFTGAIARKIGKFEAADKGTLFLDEISNISIDIQAKLLRVIQEKEIERIGSNELIKVSTRIIAASNRDLKLLVRESRFREDLFYRLNVVPVHLPPLRERRDDIPLFIDYFIETFDKEYSRDVSIDIDGRLFLIQYDWPGNIRQLENVIRRIVLLSSDGVVGKEIVMRILHSEDTSAVPSPAVPVSHVYQNPFCTTDGKRKTMAEIEKEVIVDALQSAGYNISETAKALNVARKTIHNKLKEYKIVIKKNI